MVLPGGREVPEVDVGDHDAEENRDPGKALAFYFAVLYIGNLVGAFVISNPINIVVSAFFGIRFGEYARWMVLPALVSIVVSFLGLALFFRKAMPSTYRIPTPRVLDALRLRFLGVCVLVLALTLAGFFSEGWTGFPPWLVAKPAAEQQGVLSQSGGRRFDPG